MFFSALFVTNVQAQLETGLVARTAEGFTVHIALEDVSPFELHAGPTALSLGAHGSTIPAAFEAEPIIREMPDLWVTPLSEHESVAQWQVSYEVQSSDGVQGVLVHERDPRSRVKVVARPLPAREVSTTGGKTRYGMAGARLYLHFDEVKLAGRYAGVVLVKLDRR